MDLTSSTPLPGAAVLLVGDLAILLGLVAILALAVATLRELA